MKERTTSKVTVLVILGCLILGVPLSCQKAFPTTYYVKNGGNDGASGTSDASAWSSISKVNGFSFVPGDVIMFKRGSVWHETLNLGRSGSSGNPIVYRDYGTGAKPKFDVAQNVPGWRTAGNWSSQGGNVWRIDMGVTSYGERLKLDGREYPNAYSVGHIDSYQRFYAEHPSSNYLYVYATSNPASFYSSMVLNECDRSVYPYGCGIDASYITLLNLEFYGGQVSIEVYGGDHNLIDSCKVGEFANNGLHAGVGVNASYWTVRNSVFDAADSTKHDFEYNHGNSDMMYLMGGTIEYWDIHHNEFKDCHHTSLTLGYTQKRTGSVSHNKIHDNYIHWTPPTDYGRGLSTNAQTVGACSYNEFYRNRIVGQSTPGQIGGDRNRFYYNIWDSTTHPQWSGASGGEAGGYHEQDGLAIMMNDNAEGVINQDIVFVNNIFMNGALPAMRIGPGANVIRDTIMNNIFYRNGIDVPSTWGAQYKGLQNVELYFVGDLGSGGYHCIKNNLVFNPYNSSPIIWNQWVDGTHRTVAWLEANIDHNSVASGNIATDPLLGSDYKIPTNSRAKDAGLNYAIGGSWDHKDYFGNIVPFNGVPDIGVQESSPADTTLGTTLVPPALSSPSNNSVLNIVTPTLAWNAVPGATGYGLQLWTDSLFISLVVDDQGIAGTSRQMPRLDRGRRHFWHVRTKNAYGFGPYSPQWAFVVATLPESTLAPPALASPSNNSTVNVVTPTLRWNAVPGATAYGLQVSTDSLFVFPIVDDQGLTTTSSQMPQLQRSVRHYWRVRTWNFAGFGFYSGTRSFVVSSAAPPALHSPPNGSIVREAYQMLTWETVPGAGYGVQVAGDSLFSSLVVDDQGLTVASRRLPSLVNGTTYFWHVRMRTGASFGPYTTTWRFLASVSPGSEIGGPLLAEPANGEKVCNAGVTLSWTAIANADRYRVQVSRDSLFRSITVDTTTMSPLLHLRKLVWGMSYFWRVGSFQGGIQSLYSDVWRFDTLLPSSTSLLQNFPNPFNPTTKIQYILDSDQEIVVEVFDILGRLVRTLERGKQTAGKHSLVFDAIGLATGVYFVHISTPDFIDVMKMLYVK